ncbi:DUF2179 domain-containing protein [Bacillus sp. 1NLA3E]|uniref:DUF2179 domain-containing protein n=1 Tax=Bacillus sp. 1NLA3E TaxID=666686 RepID=UPI000247F3FE|nr:DUF2179 domain-containing protein [Bacillus sp. 1NLA3E]AGK52080.1 hypothetical protein B1NLA3E_01480 [Bacillus sp. 1NLA3E]
MLNILLIFALQLLYVPVLTLRTIFLVKNMSVAASSFGVLEALIYVFGLSLIFSDHQSIAEMVVYAVGFGVGLYIGTRIENKLAIGYTCVFITLQDMNEELLILLRERGFGVTVFKGMGRDGKRYRLEILSKRNRENELMTLIEEHEQNAFIISYEPRRFKGGFLAKFEKNEKL